MLSDNKSFHYWPRPRSDLGVTTSFSRAGRLQDSDRLDFLGAGRLEDSDSLSSIFVVLLSPDSSSLSSVALPDALSLVASSSSSSSSSESTAFNASKKPLASPFPKSALVAPSSPEPPTFFQCLVPDPSYLAPSVPSEICLRSPTHAASRQQVF